MGKLISTLTAFVFVFFIYLNANAQTANTYLFSTSTGGVLNPMTGSTNLIAPGAPLGDDGPSALTTFPGAPAFVFPYEALTYTQFTVTPDGFCKLGSPVGVAQNTNVITNTTNRPKVFPLWDNLAIGTLAGGGKVHYLMTGSFPNRIFIIEWYVTIPRNISGPANSRFQLWLYENGRIAFVYGTLGIAPSSSVGINSIVANPSNFESVTISSHTMSTTIENNTNSISPASGRIYTFTPTLSLLAYLPGQGCPEDITVEFRNFTNPNTNLIAPQVVSLPVSGAAKVSIGNIAYNNNAYIVIKHPNSLETWSKLAQPITAGMTYSFRSSVTQAFCDNQRLFSGVPAIHRGDFNQDGIIDVEDVNQLENDINNFVTGNAITDLDCSGFVDFSDLFTMSLDYYPIIVSNPSFLIFPQAYVNRPPDPSLAYPNYCDVEP